MNNIRQLTSSVILNGVNIPVLSWTTHYTSYGNLCTFEVAVPVKEMKQVYPNIFKDQNTTPQMDCKIMLYDQSGFRELVFDGIVDTIEGTWEDDLLEISGRDFSAILRDTTDTLDKYINQPIGQVVQGIAQQYGLNTNINAPPLITGIKASTFQGENWSFSASPQPTWHIIQQLAEECDCVAYVDQYRTLNFVPPGTGGQNHQYIWRPTFNPNNANSTVDPILKLAIMQQSQRCNNFTLFLHGYDSNMKQTIYYEQQVGQGGRIVHKNRQDVNAQNYKQIAQSLVDEIQRKNLVAKLVVEGDITVNLNDTVNINEAENGDLLGLAGQSLFVVGIVHSFSMPDYGSSISDGFLTHLTCNQALTGQI